MRTGNPRPKTIDTVYKALKKAYGPAAPLRKEAPLDVLVRTILSQNTSDINSDNAYLSLRRRFSKWEDVMRANPQTLAKAIRRGGLANIKSKRIIKTLKTINEREGKLSLDRLKTLNDSDMLSYLTSLPGTGVKTACCVMLFAFSRPVMPVDTHVSRVARRLGWVSPDVRTDGMHEHLEKLVPERRILPMHLYMIQHGRRICRARNPICADCPIKRHCAFFMKGPE